MIRRLFRPEYGTIVRVRPRRWWSPRQRRAARVAGTMLSHEADRIVRAQVDAMVHGLSVVRVRFRP